MGDRAELALRIVALAVWLAVGSPVWAADARPAALWLALYPAFAVAMWLTTRPTLASRVRLVWLVGQSVCAVALAVIGMPHFEGALLALVAAQAAWFLSPGISLGIGVLQAIPLLLIVLPTHGTLGALTATGEYGAFALFATLVGYLRMEEREARLELARERAVLLGMQSLLEDGARMHERTRLAREMHDAMGHGLTAASVSLQVASRTGDKTAIEAAQKAVQSALADVRSLVGTMREPRTVDLRSALRALATATREPRIVLEVPEDLELRDERRAHALFRLAQEGITNAVRHGRASVVRVVVEKEGDAIHARVRDDGVGNASPQPGNGLLGLKERLVEVGGDMDTSTSQGKGFELHGWVPQS